jgi:hypothetical protein
METRGYVIEVIFDAGWKIGFEGQRFGPYASKQAAVETASEWVENGKKQGHQVSLAIRTRPMVSSDAGDGGASPGRAA